MGISTTPASWQPVIIGLMLGLYWLKVLQLVARTKKTVGRAANFFPPEKLGLFLRVIWIPAVLAWIFVPMVAPFVTGLPSFLTPIHFPGSDIVAWLAVGVAAAAFAITWVCWTKMGKSWRMGIDPNEKTELVYNGPYAYVRHPIYGLSQVLVLATLAALPSLVMLMIAIIHMALMQWEVRREDKYLVALHGRAYADYMKKVGRFVPRIGL
ncbi:MAG TPA: isoprenylcysteine carboxylmethyltransferase family protein [Phycisphaerae bacterium]|jgi:protein-S-isoprenylcysteine O-methyltransferase Ste14|nr:isoprenylcysteine carboxylmethyltransferase family protein [Phycisphaerae bacterium]